jgi:hypothetical protein
MWKEIKRRLTQAARLLSCALNVALGTGDSTVTWSAGSWHLWRDGSLWGGCCVVIINIINRPFVGRWGHCREAWEKNRELLRLAGRDVRGEA